MKHPVHEISAAEYAKFMRPDGTLEDMRTGFDKMAPEPSGDVTVTETEVGGVPGRWVVPPGSPATTMLHFHAGGYVTGSSYSHRDLGARLALAADARVLLLDYRLAPEAPFPAAHDDALAAYRALLADGVDPGHLIVSGDSAGGGLALALVLSLRDAGDPLPAAVVTISPFADLTMSGDTMQSNAPNDPLVSFDALKMCADTYLMAGGDPTDPRCSPYFGDYTGFPPMLMHVGSNEVLLDDTLRIAEKARGAGVEVHLQPAYQMVHIYHMFAHDERVPEAGRDVEVIGDFVKSKVG